MAVVSPVKKNLRDEENLLSRLVYDAGLMANELNDAVDNFSAIVRSAIDATRRAGRHAETSLTVLTIFTNAVPIGAATGLSDSLLAKFMPTDMDEEELIAQVVDLVVPLSGVEIEDGKSLSNSRPPSS